MLSHNSGPLLKTRPSRRAMSAALRLSTDNEPARDHACRFGVGASRKAGLFASDADREFARLDDAFALVVNDCHSLSAERERDGLLFARLEKDSLDPGQRSDRR